MKLLFKGLITVFLFATISTVSMAAELSGTVVKVSDLEVTVKVDGELMPVAGDMMEISFTLPDGESLPVGTWQIIQVTGNMAVATVNENTGDPVAGHKAVIFSENPVPLLKARNEVPQNASTTNSNDLTGPIDEAQRIIEQMRSSDSGEKRNAARNAYKRFLHKPSVITVAAEELEKGYNIRLTDRYYVDAMAWLCNVLGGSNDRRYMALLKKISKESKSEKIRDFAKKNYKKLR